LVEIGANLHVTPTSGCNYVATKGQTRFLALGRYYPDHSRRWQRQIFSKYPFSERILSTVAFI